VRWPELGAVYVRGQQPHAQQEEREARARTLDKRARSPADTLREEPLGLGEACAREEGGGSGGVDACARMHATLAHTLALLAALLQHPTQGHAHTCPACMHAFLHACARPPTWATQGRLPCAFPAGSRWAAGSGAGGACPNAGLALAAAMVLTPLANALPPKHVAQTSFSQTQLSTRTAGAATRTAGAAMQGQDFQEVVIRKRAPKASDLKDEAAVNAVSGCTAGMVCMRACMHACAPHSLQRAPAHAGNRTQLHHTRPGEQGPP